MPAAMHSSPGSSNKRLTVSLITLDINYIKLSEIISIVLLKKNIGIQTLKLSIYI